MADERTTGGLVSAAAAGDQDAWDALVARFNGLMWGIARGFRLDATDAGDAVQTTWLRLVENLDRIQDPERLPGWLATTVRRECVRQLRSAGRERLVGDESFVAELAAPSAPLDAAILADERDAALWRALGTLTHRCQQLLRVLMASPPPPYTAVAEALDIPIGSIGPSRGRCLDQLRRVAATDDLLGSGTGDVR